jgi:hypothetical protein
MPREAQGKGQADRFREVARALECDDDEAHFDAKLKKVAKVPKPKDEKPEK